MEALTVQARRLLLFLLLFASSASYAGLDVVLVAEKNTSLQQRLVQKFIQQNSDIRVTAISSGDKLASGSYLVAVGKGAPDKQVYNQAAGVIGVLISREQALAKQLDSAIYVEPPLARQIQLADKLLPGAKKLGLLVDKTTDKARIRKELSPKLYDQIQLVALQESDNLNQALYKVLKDSRALVGAYDNSIYNAANIKNILITSYRQHKVLIGPSKAYLKAGSFATTFSNLDDVVKRTLEIIFNHAESGEWSEAGYNPYFNILYNKQVARSLNIPLPDKSNTLKYLQEAER